jgi:hypothetical protein
LGADRSLQELVRTMVDHDRERRQTEEHYV